MTQSAAIEADFTDTRQSPRKKTDRDRVETPYVSFWIKQGVLYCKYAHDLDVTLDVARFCVESRIFFAKGEAFPLLVDMRGIRSVTKEAREYMATVGVTLVVAGALITGSRWNSSIGNIFLKIDKPQVPTRLFTREAEALAWLEQYVPTRSMNPHVIATSAVLGGV